MATKSPSSKTRTSAKKTSGLRTQKSSKKNVEQSLENVFVDLLNDIYNAEIQLVDAMPDLINSAYNEDLQHALEDHLEDTKKQVERLDRIYERLSVENKKEETCEAMQGLIEECHEVISNYQASSVRDAALIIAAQKIEHYEIATYGSLCELADILGHRKVSDLLGRSLDEEVDSDRHLTTIAADINEDALEESSEDVSYR